MQEKAIITSVKALMAGLSTKERATPEQFSNIALARSLLSLVCVDVGTMYLWKLTLSA